MSLEYWRHLVAPATREPVQVPTVADIVRHVEGHPEDNARKAFSKVLEAMGRVGAYRPQQCRRSRRPKRSGTR